MTDRTVSLRYLQVRDELGVVGYKPQRLGHVYDPSYATRLGEPERCVCGRPKHHPFHRHAVRRAA